jgi:hypothetical protein
MVSIEPSMAYDSVVALFGGLGGIAEVIGESFVRIEV